MIYAPVIIPTLNRYDHFRQCLESLEKCTGADKTDVYVALDYPPSEKYVEGWKINDAYLVEKEKNHGFRSLTVYRRETNYFFSGRGNGKTAIQDATKNVDRYIFSEDDNVFSPNFLEYINKGLEKFEADPRVLAICGYRFYYPLEFEENDYFFQNVDFNFWGCGCWVNKMKESYKWNYKTMCRKLLNPINIFKVWRTGSYRMDCFLRRTLRKGFDYHDNFYSIYMLLNNMYLVMPSVTKVKNIGWDESGQNCLGYSNEVIKSHNIQIVDSNTVFEFKGTGWELYKRNRNTIIKSDYNKGKFHKTLITLIYRYLRFIGFGYIVHIFKKIFKKSQ